MLSLPLLPDAPAGTLVAFRAGEAVSRELFLQQVAALASRLPAGRPLLNLCGDRYLFALSLFAAISKGSLSLLPSSTAPENLTKLASEHPELLVLSEKAPPADLPWLALSAPPEALEAPAPTPRIAADQIVASVFTSGSTGLPQAHHKTFGRLQANAAAQAHRIWTATGGPCAVLGTVPFQHMYGLESTVLLPLLGGGILCEARPFFPGDVADALSALPAPRFLVTTPFHLRKLLEADVSMPPLAALLSATAPLAPELAAQAEAQLGAPLLEIYGSTETGQLATRRTTSGEPWQPYTGITLRQEGENTWASGAHLEQEQLLGDVLSLQADGRFTLIGRHQDLINIAGKRSSLAFLNQLANALPGVRDAAFCLPQEGESARLALFVVAPEHSAASLSAALRPHLDAIFLPRPIVFLDHLPRNATGKIPAAEMAALVAQHITQTP